MVHIGWYIEIKCDYNYIASAITVHLYKVPWLEGKEFLSIFMFI